MKKIALVRRGNIELGLGGVGKLEVDIATQQKHHGMRHEPGHRLAAAEHEHGDDGREDAPQHDTAGGNEIADRQLHDKGEEQEQPQLAVAEQRETPGFDEDQERRDGNDLVGQRQ